MATASGIQAQTISKALRDLGVPPTYNGHRMSTQGVIVQQQGKSVVVKIRYDEDPAWQELQAGHIGAALATICTGKGWVVTAPKNPREVATFRISNGL